MQNCDVLLRLMREQLEDALRVRSLDRGGCVLQIPFCDQAGDPLRLLVRLEGNRYIVEDAGTIAGHLFSLGQHTQDTPAYKLLHELIKAHEFEIDLNEGRVGTIVQEYELIDRVLDLAKVIITIVTATPHMRVRAHRLRRVGSRVRAKIRQNYTEMRILHLVEPYYELSGTAVETWPIDFHWRVQQDNRMRDIYILAVDLDVAEPLQKVNYLTALAVDVKSMLNESSLRVVADAHGQNSEAAIAMRFLQQHRRVLGYALFDFGNDSERNRFLEQSVDEILSEQGTEWRNLWREHTART